jgi:hypothetical protein
LAQRLARAAAAPETAAEASRALFTVIVEPLADSFDPAQAAAYIPFFRAVLGAVRKKSGWEAIDAALSLPRVDPAASLEWDGLRKIVVLSRVTLGADIAVTSVILRAALDLPSAPAVWFAAGPKNLALFAGEPRVRPLEVAYPRGGTLLERLNVWLETRRAIERVAEGLGPGELLVLDPDSRTTQLGLLPVAPPGQQTLFFDSRTYREGEPGPLAAIAAEWFEEQAGARSDAPLPWLALPAEDRERAAAWRTETPGPLAAVNFGVGGNAAKRVADPFEREALKALAERGFRIVLDAGAGQEERARAERLLEGVGAAATLHEGSFASFAAVVGVSDLFLGYDSGAAHAAAALGVPAIDIFSGAPTETMRSRWSPWGKRPALVLPVDAGESPENVLWRLRELLP